jgi:hypothetical protein
MRLSLPAMCIALAGLAVATRGEAPTSQPVYQGEKVTALQQEPEDPASGRYDWGPSVMFDEGLYRMWWVRLGGANQTRFPYAGPLPDGERFEFTYPDRGDRIYYAESRDGRSWNLTGDDYGGKREEYGQDSKGPLFVLGPAETDQQRMHLGNPSVIKVHGVFYMYYEAACMFALHRNAQGAPAVGDEYHNQVFLATSPDGKTWTHHPDNANPQPILAAPEDNRLAGRRRYGFGQPSVCYRDGRYIMHYVDSCTGPGDFIVRLEADNPRFRDARTFRFTLATAGAGVNCPPGAVARFAQTDVKYLGDLWCLLRPAYGTGRLGLLISESGVFTADARSREPREVFPQIDTPDPRGPAYRERLYPRFLTNATGEIRVEQGNVVIYYASGLGFKDKAYTWDLRRCELSAELIVP